MPPRLKRRPPNEAQAATPPCDNSPTTLLLAQGGLLSPAEAAERLAVPVGLLERWRATGEGPPFVRLSKKTIRYRAADLDAFVSGRVCASTAA